MLQIDYREKRLLELVPMASSSNLEMGDIQMLDFVFERKTVADLLASVKDSRYHEQKARLLSAYPPQNIVYIIEGPNRGEKILEGCVTGLLFRDHVHVIFTRDTMDTARWLIAFYERLTKNPEKYLSGSSGEWVENVKIKSRRCENIDPRTCFMMQLCTIPLISTKIAAKVLEVSGTSSMNDFIEWLKDGKGTPTEKLVGIPLLGKKKAENILEYCGLVKLTNRLDQETNEAAICDG